MDARIVDVNAVARAIRMLGGITQSVVKTAISEATWHRWRRMGRIADPQAVFLVADLTGISARELAGLRVVPGGSPMPSDGERGHGAMRKEVARRRSSTRLTASAADVALALSERRFLRTGTEG